MRFRPTFFVSRPSYMQHSNLEKINVIASFAAFTTDKQKRRLVPHRFMMRNGDVHVVASVRKSYTEVVGDAKHVHFVVKTTENRYFDIVYDSKEMAWLCVLEIEEGFLVEAK